MAKFILVMVIELIVSAYPHDVEGDEDVDSQPAADESTVIVPKNDESDTTSEQRTDRKVVKTLIIFSCVFTVALLIALCIFYKAKKYRGVRQERTEINRSRTLHKTFAAVFDTKKKKNDNPQTSVKANSLKINTNHDKEQTVKGTNQSPPAYDFATDMQMCEEEKVKKNEGTNQDAK